MASIRILMVATQGLPWSAAVVVGAGVLDDNSVELDAWARVVVLVGFEELDAAREVVLRVEDCEVAIGTVVCPV